MKIVQLLPELNEGGVERGVVELSRELVKLGHESVVVSNGGKQSGQINLDGGRHITLDVCSKNPLTAPFRILQLRRCLRKLNPDVIHARSRVPAWLTWLANKPLHIPFVTTVHGFNSVNAYSRIMTRGDRVICVSNAIKDYIQKNYQVSGVNISVIPRGIDLMLFNPEKINTGFTDKFILDYGLENRFIVTTVGRITQLKDFETFIKSIALIKKNRSDVIGLIVGGVHPSRQAYYKSLQDLVVEMQLEDCIVFTGSIKEIPEVYALSDVIVSSSKKPESFGRTAAEAIAMERPVVATNHGGVTDIVLSGENGFLVDIEDSEALACSILSAAELPKCGLRAGISEKFNLRKMVSLTVSEYMTVINNAAK